MTSQAFHGNSEIRQDSGSNQPMQSLWRRVSEKVCSTITKTRDYLSASFKCAAKLVCLGLVSAALITSSATAAFAEQKYDITYVPYPLMNVNNNGVALLYPSSNAFKLYDIATGNTSEYDLSEKLPATANYFWTLGLDDINRVSGYLEFTTGECKGFVYNTKTKSLTIVRNPVKQPLEYRFLYIPDIVNAPNLWTGSYDVLTTRCLKGTCWQRYITYGFTHNGKQLKTLSNPFVNPSNYLNTVNAAVEGGTWPYFTNKKGIVVGTFQDLHYYDYTKHTMIGNDKPHTFLRDANDNWKIIDYDNSTITHPLGLTNTGKVLTRIEVPGGSEADNKGMIYNSTTGKWQSYPIPSGCVPSNFNSKGVIVGSCQNSGTQSGYVATPVKPAAPVRAVQTPGGIELSNR